MRESESVLDALSEASKERLKAKEAKGVVEESKKAAERKRGRRW